MIWNQAKCNVFLKVKLYDLYCGLSH